MKLRAPKYLGAAAVYFLVISAISHLPGSAIESLGWNLWDKPAHMAAYTPLGLLVFAGLTGSRGALTLKRLFVFLVLSIGLSAIDEIHQSFVPGRFASVLDAAADCLGCGLGAFLWHLRQRRKGG